MLSTVLDTGETKVKKTRHNPCPDEAEILQNEGGMKREQGCFYGHAWKFVCVFILKNQCVLFALLTSDRLSEVKFLCLQ